VFPCRDFWHPERAFTELWQSVKEGAAENNSVERSLKNEVAPILKAEKMPAWFLFGSVKFELHHGIADIPEYYAIFICCCSNLTLPISFPPLL
jgi:hypothetical protein